MDYLANEEIVEHFFDKIRGLIIPSEKNNYKSRFLQSNTLLYCVVLLLALRIVAVFISINIPQNIFFADITRATLENLVNQTRQSSGLQSLSDNQKLQAAAQFKAENMVQNQYFDHTSPTGVTPWHWFLQAGYNYKYAGENLAIGFFDSQEVYDAWLNSPSHKANIVNPNYTEIGTAVMSGFGSNDSIIVVQEFGSLLPVKTVVAKTSAPKTIAPKTVPVQTKTIPTTIAPAQVPVNNSNEEVLSQSVVAPEVVKPISTGVAPKIINAVLYNYDIMLQDVIYGFSLVVIGILLMLIFFNFKIDFKKELVVRSVLIVILLSLATALNRGAIISLIPHQIII
jgi:hypothetical protein